MCQEKRAWEASPRSGALTALLRGGCCLRKWTGGITNLPNIAAGG